MDTKWYLYIRMDTLQVSRCSPILEKEDGCQAIEIDSELGVNFVQAPHTLREYVVYRNSDKLEIIKKEKAAERLQQFFFTPAMLKEDVPNPEFQVIVNTDTNEIKVRVQDKIINYVGTMYQNVPEEKRIVELYISAKNDPNKLLEIISVNMDVVAKRVSDGYVSQVPVYPFKHKIEDVSFFTRKVLDSYGLYIETKDKINEAADE